MSDFRYEPPRPKPALAACHIYHSLTLPGETLEGDWDLRPVLRDYTAEVEFKGKRVLDAGTATGLLSFTAEAGGAREVVSFDGVAGGCVPVPWCENDAVRTQQACDAHLERVKNGYWYAWHALASQARVVYGDVNALERGGVGEFEVVLAGCILLHLRDPLGALQRLAGVCRETLVIAELEPAFTRQPVLLPNFLEGRRDPGDLFSWWQFPPEAISRFLDVLGFKTEAVARFQVFSPKAQTTARFYALRARRTL